jgi:acyl-coenzyme A thioesterase PaaI-like protein
MSPGLIRRLINLYPPLLGAGIRVTYVSPDWRCVEVQLRLRWWNRNAVGTMFGASLFAMVDPFYPLMLQHNLGPDYAVWVKSAEIDFVAPGRHVARAALQLSEEKIAEIRAATAAGGKSVPAFEILVADPEGKPIARIRKQVHVRRKREASQRSA